MAGRFGIRKEQRRQEGTMVGRSNDNRKERQQEGPRARREGAMKSAGSRLEIARSCSVLIHIVYIPMSMSKV